ncbi:type VI secretion system ATPase TssH, partial [Polaribacter sp.]|nr:type VI secretion system ATPase TssH [Polaribacter sp.]
MNFNNYTTKAQETIQLAQEIAQAFGHNQIENEHVFKALTQVDENVLPFILKKLDINIAIVIQTLEKHLESLPKVSGADLLLSRIASKSLTEAAVIAKKMKDEFISIEHLILGIFKSKSTISQILKDLGATEKGLEHCI